MIRPRTAESLTSRSTGPVRLRHGPLSGAACLALGLLVALVAGCSPSSTSPTPVGSPASTAGFSSTGSMTAARDAHTAALLSDGRVLIAGSYDGSTYLASAELYDPKTGSFSPTGSTATPRAEHTATLLPDGRVLIAGGTADGSTVLASAELYDSKTGTFSPTSSMTAARGGHTATLLPDGRVLIIGGYGGSVQVASAELYL